MVSSEGGDADGERTGTMYATVTLLATPSPFPLIDTKSFPTLPLCSPPVISRFSIAIGPLAVSLPPAEVDTEPRHPHSALLLHCALEVIPGAHAPSLSLLHHRPARASPRCSTGGSATLTFSDVGTFVPSASEPRPRTPCTAPALPLRQTVTSAPARIPLILHLCLPLFAVHLARTAPPPYCTHPLPSPHSSLHLSWSSPSIWLSTASASGARIRLLVLIHSRTLAGVSFAYSRMYPTYIASIPSCISRIQHSSPDTLPLTAL
ncbi:hypothetical protein B0H13DRAFT_2358155 [Mycena leptocephala]|nr:hypothetical protein B0H13DRAFT_2358155 [Mycena leptocephala]